MIIAIIVSEYWITDHIESRDTYNLVIDSYSFIEHIVGGAKMLIEFGCNNTKI